MKELKILAVVVFFTLVTYWLVEPFAHSQMHKHVDSKDFIYDGSDDVAEVESSIAKLESDKTNAEKIDKDAEKEKARLAKIAESIASAKTRLEAKKTFFADVKRISAIKGDATVGEATYGSCTGCHYDGAGAMGGVIPPVLTNAGVVYDKDYLIGIIKDPAMISNVDHKFNQARLHPMDTVKYMVSSDEDIANVVAYMQSIAPKAEDITPAIAFEDACGRCHAVNYEKWTQIGTTPTFKHKKDALAFEIKVLEYQDSLTAYMGKLPPDLSMYFRSRNEHFLSTFIENPQGHLAGTAMPRVGVTADSAEKIVEYLADSADTKRHERAEVGKNVMIFSIIFAIFALLWKKQVWRDLH